MLKILQVKNWKFIITFLLSYLYLKWANDIYVGILFFFLFSFFIYTYIYKLSEISKIIYKISINYFILKVIIIINFCVSLFFILIGFLIIENNPKIETQDYTSIFFFVFLLISLPSIYVYFPYVYTKIINSAEQKREVKVLDHKLDLLLAIFWFVGFLFFMPRINKLYLEYLEKNKTSKI